MAERPPCGSNNDRKYGHDLTAAAAQGRKSHRSRGDQDLIEPLIRSTLASKRTGYRFKASLETNLQVENTIVAPSGAVVYGRLAQASSRGRMYGKLLAHPGVTDIVIQWHFLSVMTSTFEIKGKGEVKRHGFFSMEKCWARPGLEPYGESQWEERGRYGVVAGDGGRNGACRVEKR